MQGLYNVALHANNMMNGEYRDRGDLYRAIIQILFGEFKKKKIRKLKVQTGYIFSTIKSLPLYRLVQCLLNFQIFAAETHYSSGAIVLVH